MTFLFAGQFFFVTGSQQPELALRLASPPERIVRHLELTAESVMVMEIDSGMVLYEKNIHQQRAIASLTKLMTALLILEDDAIGPVIAVDEEATQIYGSQMHLLAGEQLATADLLRGLLIRSANDAAIALAIAKSGSVSDFVDEMNRRVHFLGLKHTRFANPHGLDDPENYSSAFDIAMIAKKILEHEFVRTVVRIRQTTVTDVSGRFEHELKTTNELLSSPFPVYGLKTGTTDEAGQCFIGLIRSGGQEYLIVVLGSEDRFHDTKTLIWALENRGPDPVS